ncbi:MAG: hypothetical protein ABIC04_01800 [Nanoarchaeota archaeon]
MKKIVSLIILSVFMMSFVSAQDVNTDVLYDNIKGAGDAQITPEQDLKVREAMRQAGVPQQIRANVRDRQEDRKEDIVDALQLDMEKCVVDCKEKGKENCAAECKLADRKEDVRERNREMLTKYKNLNPDDKEKFMKLNEQRLQKIQGLDEKQVDAIKSLKANSVRRITEISGDQLKKVALLEKDQIEKLAYLNNRKIKAYAELKDDQLSARLDKLKITKIKQNEKFVERKIEKAVELNKNYDLAKQEYVRARNYYGENKGKFAEAKNKVTECTDSEECTQYREEALEKAKEYVLSIADTLNLHLEKIRNRIESSESLNQEQADKASEEIVMLIEEISGLKERAEAATTKDEIQDAANELNKLAQKVRKRAKIRAVGLFYDSTRRLVKLGDLISEKSDCEIRQLEETEMDVTDLDQLLDTFNGHIESAKESFLEGKELLLTGTEDAANEAHQKIKEGRESLKSAIQIKLKQTIRDAGGGACEDEEIIIVEEEEGSITDLITEEIPLDDGGE